MAKQRYYGEKFKPTKGAFGNKSKYQKSLEQQADLRKQIAEFEEKQKQAEDAKKTETVKKAVTPKAKKAEKKQENATTATE